MPQLIPAIIIFPSCMDVGSEVLSEDCYQS